MYQMMINRKSSKRGFTLVEVIVVLVILAILAAIMIPAMTGWIDKAKEKRVVVNARTFMLAAQTLASEAYGEKTTAPTSYEYDDTEIIKLTGATSATAGTATVGAKAQITKVSYSEGGITVEWSSTSQKWEKQ